MLLAAVLPALRSPPANATYVPRGLALGDPRTLVACDKLRSDIVSFDARRPGRVFGVPMFLCQGEHDRCTVTDEVRDYAAEIDGPRNLLAIVPGAGHSMMLTSAALLELLLARVRPIALEAER